MVVRTRQLGCLAWRHAVLWCVFALGVAAPARAANPVSADPTGMCAGMTPCFMDIAQAVFNAGPPPVVINIFPGTYVESVDLSLLGSAIGENPGEVTLRAVDGAGVPTPGTASIEPAAGAAVRNSVSPYPGNITIEGLAVKSPNIEGIGLVMQGTLVLAGVVSDGNGGNGLNVAIQNGELRIRDSSFSDSVNGAGISASGPIAVVMERVTADANDQFGASLSLPGPGAVQITDSSFSDSVDSFGLSFNTASDVVLERVTARANDSFGASFTLSGGARIADCDFSTNDGFGLSFSTATNVMLENVAAAGNRLFNTSFSAAGAVHLRGSSFGNSIEGFGLSVGGATEVVVEQVAAAGNALFNASFGAMGPVTVNQLDVSNSKTGFGLSIIGATNAALSGVTADGNDLFGASLSVENTLRIVNSSFSRSVDLFGLSFTAPNAVLLSIVVEGNKTNGLNAVLQSGLVSSSRFALNGDNGVLLNTFEPVRIVRFSCNDFIDNGTGLRLVDDATVNAENNFWGAASGPMHPGNPAGTGDSIVDGANGGSGTVDFEPFLTVPSADSAVCHPRGAPALGAPALAVLVLALLVLPAWRLARRTGTDVDSENAAGPRG